MIGTMFGADPVARAFYNHKPAGGQAIALTNIGSNHSSAPGGVLDIASGTIPANATVLVGLAFNHFLLIGDIPVAFVTDGRAFNRDVAITYDNVSDYRVCIYSVALGGTGVSGDTIEAQFFAGGGGDPSATVMFALYVTGLTATPLDKTASAAPAASGTQDSGLTAATAVAHELVYGIIGTTGSAADTVGAWQAGLAARRNDGLSGMQLKEGFAVVNATGTQRAEVTGATPQTYGALCATYKGT